ncbi:MAG: DUF1329 domain-containing protein [Opitutaceae bacterium]|nr:DUF1329 domain-containing protein [Opitutaceae bacterium]
MRTLLLTVACGSLLAGVQVNAALDANLTPMGAERAANADGTIPAWTGGITAPLTGYKTGDHHADPFVQDTAIATITAANLDQYADKLTAGNIALLKAYDDYKLVVYPTRRSASFPQHVYDATARNAETAKLTAEGNGIQGALIGVPFPVPTEGLHVIWNHLCRYRGESAIRRIAQAAPQRNGAYSLVEFEDSFLFLYALPDTTEKSLGNTLLYYKQATLAPARLAGSILLVQETLDQVKEPRNAWIYNAGQRRVRRAPNVGYDSPGTNSDNMRTNDQFDMFNGAPDRYDWKLLGKREMIVPYNSYRLHAKGVSYDDILKPRHINQDLARYELHRVWVVEATLKPGKSHVYARRTFYVDEDSWQVLVVDQYDQRGQIWRVSEAHCVNYYEVPLFWSTLEVHTDLQAGRYLAVGLDNQNPMYNFAAGLKREDFTPSALQREGVR